MKKSPLTIVSSKSAMLPAFEVLTWEKLQECIAKSQQPGVLPFAVMSIIMPELAARIVNVEDGLNTRNRPTRKREIDRYAADMVAGRFWFNGDSVRFTVGGWLGDGQNRLWACVKAGQPFAAVMVFGIPNEAYDTIDQGKRRDHADVLAQLGAKFPRDTANAVKWAEWFETNQVIRRPLYTPHEIGELYLNKHKNIEDFIHDARRIAKANGQSVGMVGAFIYHTSKIDRHLSTALGEAWASGTRPPRFHGITTMQVEILAMKKRGTTGGHRHEVTRAAMAINAWNSARLNSPTGVAIRWTYGRRFPTFK